MLSLLGLQPFHYAVDVETMGTSAPDKWTIISGTLAIRTTTIEGNPEKKFVKNLVKMIGVIYCLA